MTKSNDLAGEPVEPGDRFAWNIYVACSGIDEDCVDFVFTDIIPTGLELDEDSLPTSTETRTVEYDESTGELTISYSEPLDNPPGEEGWTTGSNETFDLGVTLPEDTDRLNGDEITNTATVDAVNGDPGTAEDTVTVSVPREVDPVTTKNWSDGSAVAGSGETGTITLGVRNDASTSAEVDSLTVTDTTAETFEHVDLTAVDVTQWPAGADTAQLSVCVAAGSACPPGAFVAGPESTTSPLPLPAGVDAGDVTGVEVTFTNGAGEVLPDDADGGVVELGTVLRDTYRSTGEPLQPTDVIELDNCASTSASEPELGEVAGADACAPYQIFPNTLVLGPSKAYVADADGDWGHDSGEHAVIGENSPVTARVDVTNESPFPIHEIVISDPGDTTAGEPDKLDVETVRVRLPAGATHAELEVTFDDGGSSVSNHTENTAVDVSDPGRTVTDVTVTYTGADGDGNPTIEPGSTAGLDLHGRLTDAVDDADLGDGVDNCASVTGDAGRGDGTGTYAGEACNTVVIESPRSSGSGTKSVSQDTFPEDQPVDFTLETVNDGNLPLVDPVVTDPARGTDPANNPFEQLELLSASVTQSPNTPPITIEIDVPGSGWQPYDEAAAADLAAAQGVRAVMDGDLAPTEAFTLHLTVQRRAGVDDGVAIANCYGLTAGGEYEPSDPWCAPTLQTGPADAGATLNKTIAPSEVPIRIPGVPPQPADVTLRTRNTGNMSAQTMQLIDDDPEFFDAVDFNQIEQVDPPAGADRVQFDALVDGSWVDGDPTPVGSPTFAPGVDPASIEGVRVTFSSTSDDNDGFVITPCDDPSCEGAVVFSVNSRETLRSDPETRVEGTVDNTVTGNFQTRLDEPGEPRDIPPNSDDLSFVEGTPELDVAKGPSGQVTPGEPVPFDLEITNTGTDNLPELVVVDVMPPGLGLDTTYDGPDGPYEITDVQVPDGTPEPPTPELELTQDPDDPQRTAEARWVFAGWDLAPGATLTIHVEAQLQPGVEAGDVLENTVAAGSDADVDDLVCSDENDGTSDDGTYGDGTFCTDTAEVETRAGAAFDARKWVAGNHDLGWYNNNSGAVVPAGDPSCPSLPVGDGLFTSTPCVALVNPGDQHHHLLQVRNAGTEPATDMTIVDRLPAPGDAGVLGGDRGTEWDERPTLAGPLSLDGPGTGEIGYTTAGSLCLDDLDHRAAGCPAGAWSSDYPDATAFQVDYDFDEPLAPGDGVTVSYALNTPLEVTQSGTPTIAWNSFAHGETTQQGSGAERILPPIEPIKVGVGTSYGSLEVIKEIGENPAQLPVGELEYTFDYECTSTPLGGEPTVVAAGQVTATPGAPGLVEGIAAGAECSVWETTTHGAVSSATEDEPATVTIEPLLDADDPPSSVTAINDFPMGELLIDKQITGEVHEEFTAGPYTVEADCRFGDDSLDGFPVELSIDGDGEARVDAPVGASCVVTEPGDGGATEVVFDPQGEGSSAPAVIPADGDRVAGVTVTNVFVPGSLVIVKDVEGAGVPEHSTGPFTFEVDCSIDEQPSVFTTTVTVEGSDDGSIVRSEPIGGLPLGASCTVTEVDDGGADATPEPVTVTIERAEGEEVAVVEATFVNPFSAGTVAVTKMVDGPAADSEDVQGLTFDIAVTCATETGSDDDEPERTTWYEGTLTVADGETAAAVHDDGEPALLPVGARCWADELTPHGATEVTIEHDSYETGIEIAGDDETGVQEFTIEVTNTFDPPPEPPTTTSPPTTSPESSTSTPGGDEGDDGNDNGDDGDVGGEGGGDGGGSLPQTGSTIAGILLLAAVLVLMGLALRRRSAVGSPR